MSVTKTKNFAIAILAVLFVSFLLFATPIVSYASDINGVDISVGEDGKLTIGGDSGFQDGGSRDAWNNLFIKYRAFIVGLSGIATISMIAFFVVQFMKLGATASNPQGRSQALAGVLWTGMAAAGLGAVTIIVGFFYNAIK